MSEKATDDNQIDVIDILETASGSTSDFLANHNFSATIHEHLQSNDPTPCLLELATFFRAQSALLLRQAVALEEMASYEEVATNALENIDDVMYRDNVLSWVGKAHKELESAVDRLDTIEDCLVPLKEVDKTNKLVKQAINPYSIFLKETCKSLVFPPGVPRVNGDISKATSALWNNLSKEQKQEFQNKAVQMTREREGGEKVGYDKRRKVNESDSEGSDSEDEESESDNAKSSD